MLPKKIYSILSKKIPNYKDPTFKLTKSNHLPLMQLCLLFQNSTNELNELLRDIEPFSQFHEWFFGSGSVHLLLLVSAI